MTATQQPIAIYEGNDFYVPRFEIQVGSKDLPRDVIHDIISVTYADAIEQIDRFELVVSNWDAENLSLKYVDQEIFDPGQKVLVNMGYRGGEGLKQMLDGEITSLRPTFPAAGPPTLSVSGLNILHRVRQKQESHVYEKKKDSVIAQEVGRRVGIKVRTDPKAKAEEAEHPYVLQYNESDMVFLMRRARRIGYDLFVVPGDPSELYFGPSVNVKKVTYKMQWGSHVGAARANGAPGPSLIQFQPTLTTFDQVKSVTVRGWDPVKKKQIKETVDRQQLDIKSPGNERQRNALDRSFEAREEIIHNKPVHSVKEAKTLAKETLQNIAKGMVKASGSTLGLPDLRAGSVIEVYGIGERMSGKYFVTSTTHTISASGYTTSFECRMEVEQGAN